MTAEQQKDPPAGASPQWRHNAWGAGAPESSAETEETHGLPSGLSKQLHTREGENVFARWKLLETREMFNGKNEKEEHCLDFLNRLPVSNPQEAYYKSLILGITGRSLEGK
jgi:hypothetical protein